MKQAMIDYQKRGPFDEISTPPSALEPLFPYLPKDWRIWEAAPGPGALSDALNDAGYTQLIVPSPFPPLISVPHFDAIVTNPPYSQKRQFIQYAASYGKPWALLLPITTLGVGSCQPWLTDCEMLFFSKRIDFTGKGQPWFAVAWFTCGLGIGKQLNFPDGA